MLWLYRCVFSPSPSPAPLCFNPHSHPFPPSQHLDVIFNPRATLYRGSYSSSKTSRKNSGIRIILQRCIERFSNLGGWELLLARLGDADAIAIREARIAERVAAEADAAASATHPLDGDTIVAAATSAAAASATPASGDASATDSKALEDADGSAAQAVEWGGYTWLNSILEVFEKVHT